MNNLLSGALGGIIGIVLSSFFSYLIFIRQTKLESNRIFLQQLLQVIQNIYMSLLQGKLIEDNDINVLLSFQAIGLKEFQKLQEILTEVRSKLLSYNQGVQQTTSSTSVSTLQISAKSEAEAKIKELVQELRKIT